LVGEFSAQHRKFFGALTRWKNAMAYLRRRRTKELRDEYDARGKLHTKREPRQPGTIQPMAQSQQGGVRPLLNSIGTEAQPDRRIVVKIVE
jgi:hypothetical protein